MFTSSQGNVFGYHQQVNLDLRLGLIVIILPFAFAYFLEMQK